MNEFLLALLQGVEITGEALTLGAPIAAVYNPALGPLLAAVGPLITSVAAKQGQIIVNIKPDITNEELIAAMEAIKSINWNLAPFETPAA